MQVTTIEGIVKNGQIQLSEALNLPDATKVYVVVPDSGRPRPRIVSPRVVDRSRMKDFEKEMIEIEDDEL